MKNLLNFGYNGKIFPVNPKADTIQGIKVYKKLEHENRWPN